MCTVVIRVPEKPDDAVQVLAVRDEDPARGWDPLGESWPELPGIIGVRDQRAGGAWLAAEPRAGRLAVVLNREGSPELPESEIVSRGELPFAALSGGSAQENPLADVHRMRGFNLVKVVGGVGAVVLSWEGSGQLRSETLAPGTHMLAHHDVDDARTARITQWRDAFAAAPFDEWPDLLIRTEEVGPDDDRAIVRDNRAHGWPTLTTLACLAEVRPGTAEVRYAELAEPGVPSPLEFS
ncbi:MAG TPA: NRDE family protein [Microbacterium sp.]|nr:NRDE family protein [Microbacterium sp.]